MQSGVSVQSFAHIVHLLTSALHLTLKHMSHCIPIATQPGKLLERKEKKSSRFSAMIEPPKAAARSLTSCYCAVQCALFFVEAFPTHCDCLALANILAFQLHREDSFDRTGSGSQGQNDMSNSTGGSNGNSGNVDAQMDKAVQSVSHNGSGGLSHSSSK